MPEKSILFLDQYPGLSGGQKVLLNIIRAFLEKGYRCIAVLPEAGELSKMLSRSGVSCVFFPMGYYRISRKGFFDFLGYFFRLPLLTLLLTRLINKERIRLVYANGARVFPWATLACSISKTPLVWHVHSIFERGMPRLLCVLFGRFRCVKKIFAVSQAAARPLGALSQKTEVLYNAVEKPSVEEGANVLKNEYGLGQDAFLAGTVAILEEWKNQEDLIRAAKLVTDAVGNKAYFFIVGDSLYREPARQGYKNRLKAIVRETGLDRQVIFTGFRTDTAQVIQSLDLLVLCSKTPDPCPLVSLEAATLGVAIISTSSGGVEEIFTQGSEALFYEPGDAEGLAEKIIYLIRNRPVARGLGERARFKVEQQHALGAFLERITQTAGNIFDDH